MVTEMVSWEKLFVRIELFFFGSVFSKWTFYRHRAEVPYHHAP